MRKLLKIAALTLTAFFLVSCGGDSATEPTEHVWNIMYRATNESSSDLIVALSGPAAPGATSLEYSVPAGETVELLSFEALLGSAPKVENDLWCVSLLLELDRTLVHQLCPVTNDQWEFEQPSAYQADFRLNILDEDLEPGEDNCPRLAGVVFESETGNAVAGATVTYLGQGSIDLPTNAAGRYLFYLPEGPLQGLVTVSKEGFRTVEHVLPEGVFGNGSGPYRLDFGLMRTGS